MESFQRDTGNIPLQAMILTRIAAIRTVINSDGFTGAKPRQVPDTADVTMYPKSMRISIVMIRLAAANLCFVTSRMTPESKYRERPAG